MPWFNSRSSRSNQPNAIPCPVDDRPCRHCDKLSLQFSLLILCEAPLQRGISGLERFGTEVAVGWSWLRPGIEWSNIFHSLGILTPWTASWSTYTAAWGHEVRTIRAKAISKSYLSKWLADLRFIRRSAAIRGCAPSAMPGRPHARRAPGRGGGRGPSPGHRAIASSTRGLGPQRRG